MFRRYAVLLGLVASAGCSGGPTGSDGRTTETFTVAATLYDSGAVGYPAGSTLATFTVEVAGRVDARATYDVVVDCEFVFYIESTASSGNAIIRTTSGAQTIRLDGDLGPGTYTAALVARDGGVSLCSGIPAAGIDFPHQIVVTHP